MDETTVTTMLDLMSDELIYEWSYELRDNPTAGARVLYRLVTGYLAA